MTSIENFILSIPFPVILLIGAIVGWFVGSLFNKAIDHKVHNSILNQTAGTLYKVNYSDGSSTVLLEWTQNDFDKLKTGDQIVLNVDVREQN